MSVDDLSPRGQLEGEFEEQITDLGGGRIVLMIRDGKIARYQLRFAG